MDITKIENIEKLFDTMDINLKDALVSYNNDYDPRVGIVKAVTAMTKLQEVINKKIAKILVKTLLSNLLADFAPIGAAYEEIGAIKSNPIIFT